MVRIDRQLACVTQTRMHFAVAALLLCVCLHIAVLCCQINFVTSLCKLSGYFSHCDEASSEQLEAKPRVSTQLELHDSGDRSSNLRADNNSLQFPVLPIVQQLSDAIRGPQKQLNRKTILVVGEQDWINAARMQHETDHELCGYKNCIFTGDQTAMKTADSVVWHLLTSDSERLIQQANLSNRGNQTWIIFTMECPRVGNFRLIKLQPQWFHMTMTYLSDSTIPSPYWLWLPRQILFGDHQLAEYLMDGFSLVEPPMLIRNRNIPKYGNVNEKTELKVAAVVSECGANNYPIRLRDEFTAELAKYVTVDRFGRCGVSCFNLTGNGQDGCFKYISLHYKFYLSFENSKCDEYISEKLYYAYKMRIVPIVMGASRSQYERLAPPNSFIHIDDFKSAKEMAEYLNMLHNNATLYQNYFDWHRQGVLISADQTLPFCRLCKAVSESTTTSESPTIDFETWFMKNRCHSSS